MSVPSAYEATARSAAPPAVVFDVLADAPGWSSWAGWTMHETEWEREGVPAPGGVGAVRRMGRRPQFGREEIIDYDPPTHTAYTVVSGMPVRDYRADIDLSPDGGGTVIRWRGTFTPTIPGTGGVLAFVFGHLMTSYARRAAREAERRAR